MRRRSRQLEAKNKGRKRHGVHIGHREGELRAKFERFARNEERRRDAAATEDSAAADEVDDFVAVAGNDLGVAPFLAGENFEIAFDGDAAILESKFAQKIDHGTADSGPYLSVDLNGRFHRF